MSQVQDHLKSHPHWQAVESIYHTLESHGYKAFLAGGCVRDALMGHQANDLDVATDATPSQIEEIFEKTVSVGKSFGVMRVIQDGADIELATFRTDGIYRDGRRPEEVVFSSPQEDAQRRDFTVNALFFDLKKDDVLDFVGGQQDLQERILRTVGDPEKRFQEDHLRLLRAARFAGQLGFVIEDATFQALTKMAVQVKTVSGERIRDEMYKLLKSGYADVGLKIMADSGLMNSLFPFRLRDNAWDFLRFTEVWQYFAIFVKKAEQEELQEALNLLKFSAKERKSIEAAWKLWQDPAAFFSLRIGQQLQKYSLDYIRWSLGQLGDEWRSKVSSVAQAWQEWGALLPPPFLTGDDIKSQLRGEQIGRVLAEVYELQLEKKLRSRDEALQWLQKNLDGFK